MIRILHIVTTMNRGGLETMLMNYYRNIDRTKIQFDFLCHRDFEADYDAEILSLGGRIYRLPNLNPFSRRYIKALDSFFVEHNEYKIVHSHVDCMSAVPLKYAKKHGVPVTIAHSHNSSQDKDKKYLLKLLYKKRISKYAEHMIACSEAAGKWMFCGSKFFVLANAIDAKQYSFDSQKREHIRKDLQIDGKYVIGHVGRFNPPKNHSFIIDLFRNIKSKEPNAVLLLVGDGDGRPHIEEKVKQLGIEDSVIFLGVRDDVNELMQGMDVFLLPSLYEGLPVTMIEAQASGLPCIISNMVPIECKKTDLVTQIGLEDDINVWTNTILEQKKLVRRNFYNEIVNSGFDITSNVNWLQEFYINEYNNCK